MNVAPDYEERYRIMCKRRAEGATLQAIANEFGISRERVRQVTNQHGPLDFDRVCLCGRHFLATNARQRVCGECECEICGKKLTHAQAKRGQRYCSPIHKPNYKGANSGTTHLAVERGIYVRKYLLTGKRVNDYFYVYRGGWQRFDSLAEAQKFRASSGGRSEQSTKMRKAILTELEKGPARTDQIGESLGISPRVIGTYVRHLKADRLIQTKQTERVKSRDKPVWELVF